MICLSGEPLLAGRQLSYRYLGRYPALEDVSVSVHPGDVLALLGANGSGKSTLLTILAGLVFADSGDVTAFGEPVSEAALADPRANTAFRSRVGLVFQNSDAQLFAASVREDLGFGCRQLGLTAAQTQERVADVAALLDLADLLDRAPVHLSAGQRRRAAIGSVLAMSPELILFDEPTASLDPHTCDWLAELLLGLRRAGRSMVIATHDLELAARVATRCLVLGEDHRVAAAGTAADVLADQELLRRVNLIGAAGVQAG